MQFSVEQEDIYIDFVFCGLEKFENVFLCFKKLYIVCSRLIIIFICVKYYIKIYLMVFDIFFKVGGLFVIFLLINNISYFIFLCILSKIVIF